MKFKSSAAVLMAGLLTLPVMGGGSASAPTPVPPPDQAKLSYAVGTRMGLQMLNAGPKVDAAVAIRAIEDVLEGKPTRIDESEIGPILSQTQFLGSDATTQDERENFSYAGGMRIALSFKRTGFELDPKIVARAIHDELHGKARMQESEVVALFKSAAGYEESKKRSTNQFAGQAFLIQNAKQPGINVLADGLQYQILQAGAGPEAKTNDLIYVKYRGTLINGTEFDHHDHYLTRTYGGIQGWRDVLPRMSVGSKWRIFAPASLAFGEGGYPSRGVGPGMTVIYDLEFLSIAPSNGIYQVSSGMGHGSDIDSSLPNPGSVK